MAQKTLQTQTAIQTQQQNSLQIMLSRVLELPISDMSERVRNEMLENEALEECEYHSDYEENSDNSQEHSDEQLDESYLRSDLGIAVGDYFNDDDIPDYLKQRIDAAREEHEVVQASGSTFYDDLYRQIGEQNLSEQEQKLLEYLIGSLDADGFLRKDLLTIADELAIFHNIYTDEHELNDMLHILQTFEPVGIGARTLQECLQLQLKDPDRKSPWRQEALKVVTHCFKDFVSKRWDRISERLNFNEEIINHVRHELTHLNPAPGRSGGETVGHTSPTIIPDFYVTVTEDRQINIQLNRGDIPEIRISRAFRDMLTEYSQNKSTLNREQQDAYIYARKKIDDAQSFINLLHRRNETLLAIMQSIVTRQQYFFYEDDDETQLQPLTLKDIATQVKVDISTVSRAVNSKYVQTSYGVYPLKYFFSGQFKGENGEDIATRKIKIALEELIIGENKKMPYSDDALTTMLNERGFPIARRTVAKYREQLGLPVARLRRE